MTLKLSNTWMWLLWNQPQECFHLEKCSNFFENYIGLGCDEAGEVFSVLFIKRKIFGGHMSNLSFSCFLQNQQVVLARKLHSSNLQKFPRRKYMRELQLVPVWNLARKIFACKNQGLVITFGTYSFSLCNKDMKHLLDAP